MSGMGSVLQLTNPTVVAAFRAALLHQGIVALLIFFLLALVWVTAREWVPASRTGGAGSAAAATFAEPPARRVLRIGFGILWIFDGILQAQQAMPLGLPSQVIQPAAASSPGWVQQIVNWGVRGWTYHPIDAAAGAVWIQIGIGVWLLTAARGRWSRLGGLASVGWGLIVWVFGEAFGGIFAPGLTWLFGAPGAALLYCVAGALVALPERAWSGQRLGRLVVAAFGLFLTGMAVLQGWPEGVRPGRDGPADGTDIPAEVPLVPGLGGRLVHRRARIRGQPDRSDRAARGRHRPGQRAAAAAPPGAAGSAGGVPGRLGADRGLRNLRRCRHGPQQHDPDGAGGRGRFPGPDQSCRRGG